jgi:PTH1 family peptidyl-tRNA hydrolase
MRLVAGLGNPGPRYKANRHNVGFMAVEAIARRHEFGAARSRFQALVSDGTIAGQKLSLMQPMTFMNDSGRAVGEAMRFYKLPPEELLVIHDEIDLAAGKLRMKQGGGAAGHNGLRDIDAHVGPDYWRLRIGVGHPGDKRLVHPHVLSDFTADDDGWLKPMLGAIAEAFPALVEGSASRFTTKVALILKPPLPKPPRQAAEGEGEPASGHPEPASRRAKTIPPENDPEA